MWTELVCIRKRGKEEEEEEKKGWNWYIDGNRKRAMEYWKRKWRNGRKDGNRVVRVFQLIDGLSCCTSTKSFPSLQQCKSLILMYIARPAATSAFLYFPSFNFNDSTWLLQKRFFPPIVFHCLNSLDIASEWRENCSRNKSIHFFHLLTTNPNWSRHVKIEHTAYI